MDTLGAAPGWPSDCHAFGASYMLANAATVAVAWDA